MPTDTIFVSIAAYCDPVLDFTVRSLRERASQASRVFVGVVDQSEPCARWSPQAAGWSEHVRCIHLDVCQARGPCWARALAMSLYQGEDWYMQIDSHTWFEPGWDDTLIRSAERCAAGNPRSILTCYPNPFELVDGHPVARPVTDRVLAFVATESAAFRPEDPVLPFECVAVESEEPIPAIHVGGGCMFAPGRIVEELPYDPRLYFHGEEQAVALRAWTRGWDLWQVPGMPLYHLYTQPGSAPRPMHWAPEHDAQRHMLWNQLDDAARRRLASMVYEGSDLGVYGLGTTRTLDDYAAFSGIDYRRRVIESRARKARFGYY